MKPILRKLLHSLMPGVIRPLQVLWNEIIGFLFLAIAVIFAGGVVRNWNSYQVAVRVLALLFALMMFYFGVTSFLRARRISRMR